MYAVTVKFRGPPYRTFTREFTTELAAVAFAEQATREGMTVIQCRVQ